MSITRFNEFIALPGKLAELTQAFLPILRKIRSAKGCESCEMFIAVEGKERIIIIERWADVSSHQTAAKLIGPTDFQTIIGLLEGPPAGKYFTEVG